MNEYLITNVRIGCYDFKFKCADSAAKFLTIAHEHLSDEDRPIKMYMESYFVEEDEGVENE